MNQLIKVPQLKTGNDSEVAAQLQTLFNEAQNGMRRVVALGMFCYHIKAQLKHGQFQPWLAANCEKISYRSLAGYMDLTKNVLEACGVKTINGFHKKCSALHFSNGSELLLLPEAKLPEEAKPLREKICALIDGKSQRALFMEFKQFDEDAEESKTKRGRLKGQGGATKEQREAAAAREERERLESIQVKADETTDFLLEYSDVKGFAKLDELPGGEKTLKKLADAVAYANNFFTALKKSTKQ